MNADALISKVGAVIKRFAPMDRTVFKRVITRTGDTLIGRVAISTVDTVVAPQPVYQTLGGDASQVMSADGTKALLPSDYRFTFQPGTQLTLAELQNKNLSLVLKNSVGNEERFEILRYDAPALGGKIVALIVYARGIAS